MAKQLIGKAPRTQVRTTAGRVAFVDKGRPAPADLTDEDRKRLLKEGYLVEVDVATDETEGHPAPGTVKAILAEVGDDPAKAAEALETEKAGENRATLVKKLEAIAAGSGS